MRLTDRYELRQLIGGAETWTFKALQKSSGREVFLHVRPPRQNSSGRDPVDALGALWQYMNTAFPQGPGQIVDMGECEDGTYIATEESKQPAPAQSTRTAAPESTYTPEKASQGTTIPPGLTQALEAYLDKKRSEAKSGASKPLPQAAKREWRTVSAWGASERIPESPEQPGANPESRSAVQDPAEFTQIFQVQQSDFASARSASVGSTLTGTVTPENPAGDVRALREGSTSAEGSRPGEFTLAFQAARDSGLDSGLPPSDDVILAGGFAGSPEGPRTGSPNELVSPAQPRAPGEFTRIFQAPSEDIPDSEGGPPVESAVAAGPPRSSPDSANGLLFGARPQSKPDAVPERLEQPGEFTRMFQSSGSNLQGEPPAPQPTATGGFTTTFRASGADPLWTASPSAQSAAPGEFTRIFQGPAIGSQHGVPASSSGESAPPGEFTRIFGGPGEVSLALGGRETQASSPEPVSLGHNAGTSSELGTGTRSNLPLFLVIGLSAIVIILLVVFFGLGR
jgi:hypothetical protein